jgi:hypothetical protein
LGSMQCIHQQRTAPATACPRLPRLADLDFHCCLHCDYQRWRASPRSIAVLCHDPRSLPRVSAICQVRRPRIWMGWGCAKEGQRAGLGDFIYHSLGLRGKAISRMLLQFRTHAHSHFVGSHTRSEEALLLPQLLLQMSGFRRESQTYSLAFIVDWIRRRHLPLTRTFTHSHSLTRPTPIHYCLPQSPENVAVTRWVGALSPISETTCGKRLSYPSNSLLAPCLVYYHTLGI